MSSEIEYEIVKAKVERKSLALKAKKESSDEECSTSGSEDGQSTPGGCGIPNHLLGECPSQERQEPRALRWMVLGAIAEKKLLKKIQEETCLVVQAPKLVKGLKTEQKQEFTNSLRSSVLKYQDQDKVVKSPRACHWKEREKTSPTVPSDFIGPTRNPFLWAVPAQTDKSPTKAQNKV
ncbi:hypothetical protein Tco_0375357 [Tanacetum coccineum]